MTAHIAVDTTCAPEECIRRILAEDERVSTASMISSLGQIPPKRKKGGQHVHIDSGRNRTRHRA